MGLIAEPAVQGDLAELPCAFQHQPLRLAHPLGGDIS